MNELASRAGRFDRILADRGIGKYAYTLSESEKRELNVYSGEFRLMRTVFDNAASLKVFADGRMGSAGGADLSDEGLAALAEDAMAAAESSPEDPCHDIAPRAESEAFRQGAEEPDMEAFFARMREFLDTVKKDYPRVRIMESVGSCDTEHSVYANSNGTRFERTCTSYEVYFGICAGEGDRTTGLDYVEFAADRLDRPFIEAADLKRRLEDVQASLYPESPEGKFEGTVIFTPACAAVFLGMLLENYAGKGVVMDGTSLWLDKVGEKVASEKLTVALKPYDERIVCGERWTEDGFRTEDATLIEKGVLRAHMLDLYASKKTGRPVLKAGDGLVVEPGDADLSDMIASVDRGIVMGGFSGGQPGTNGEFSGVAKNSFLIENGKVKCAVTETMVNGNLGEAVKNIRAISREVCCDGGMAVPYIAVDGIVISGK